MDQHLKMQNQNLQKNLKNKSYFKAPLPLCEITHAVIKHPTSHEEKKKHHVKYTFLVRKFRHLLFWFSLGKAG